MLYNKREIVEINPIDKIWERIAIAVKWNSNQFALYPNGIIHRRRATSKFMKNEVGYLFFYILVILLIYSEFLFSQEWIKVNPIFDPPGNYKYTYYGWFVDTKNGWWDVGMAGPGSIWYTSNGGITWSKQLDSNEVGCYDIKFIDSLHGWFVGNFIPEDEYYILITKNGGKNWNKYSTPVINCISFVDSLNGFAGGDSIYATTDGGIHWEPQKVDSGPRFRILDIFFSDRKYGWAVGGNVEVADAGVTLYTVDSGKTWQYHKPAELYGLRVYFRDSLHGCIIGTSYPAIAGAVKITNDGGKSWILRYVDAWLEDVVFTDESTGWIVGEHGFIWHTTDGGLNWERVESNTTSNLYSIFFFDSGKIGYIFGSESTLLKYDKTVGIEEDYSYKELSFELSQSYPNPFNSRTEVEFTIPKRELVIVEVYDVLGRKVRTLMNKFLEPGKHRILFDASGIPNGVYYYSLITTSRRISKKVLLIQ